jgi:hypothetical protein
MEPSDGNVYPKEGDAKALQKASDLLFPKDRIGVMELKPCPFCGKTPKIVRTDVEPQGDSWYGRRMETYVSCECGATLFDEGFHMGFWSNEEAEKRWNTRVMKEE